MFYAAWGRAAPTAVRMAGHERPPHRRGRRRAVAHRNEVDNLGFHVYRSRDNTRVRLTSSPIAGSGLLVSPGVEMGAGHTYRWTDDRQILADVEYRLEEIDLNGTRTWHGPIRPTSTVVGQSGNTAPARRLPGPSSS